MARDMSAAELIECYKLGKTTIYRILGISVQLRPGAYFRDQLYRKIRAN
jgi:hypothetical protein